MKSFNSLLIAQMLQMGFITVKQQLWGLSRGCRCVLSFICCFRIISHNLAHLVTQAHLILAASSSHIIASIFFGALSTSLHQSPVSLLLSAQYKDHSVPSVRPPLDLDPQLKKHSAVYEPHGTIISFAVFV